jgi:hypothetical protein
LIVSDRWGDLESGIGKTKRPLSRLAGRGLSDCLEVCSSRSVREERWFISLELPACE